MNSNVDVDEHDTGTRLRHISNQRRWLLRGAFTVALALLALIVLRPMAARLGLGARLNMKSIIEANGPVLFVADGVSLSAGCLTLSNPFTLNEMSKQAVNEGDLDQYRGKFLILCRDGLEAAKLRIHMTTTMTLSQPALRSFSAASSIAKLPYECDIPSGMMTVVEINDRCVVVNTRSEHISKIIFEHEHRE